MNEGLTEIIIEIKCFKFMEKFKVIFKNKIHYGYTVPESEL